MSQSDKQVKIDLLGVVCFFLFLASNIDVIMSSM